ncbi:MAG: cytochrome c oxidase subunit II [Gemmatimonadota bacterium]
MKPVPQSSASRARRAVLTSASLFLLSACVPEGDYPQTTFEPVTEFGRLLNGLFANTFWWTIGIMVLVEVLLLVFVFRFRDRPGAPQPKQIHGHTGLEITWTLIPAVIVLFIVVPTVKGIFTTQARADEGALVVEVIGHQWWWEFRYPQLGVITANELVLPTHRAVELQMYSADVIHSFLIPRVGGKRDVNPQPRATSDERARVNYLSFNVETPGYYSGQCAEFCGASHALMRSAVVALNEAAFSSWVTSMGGGFRPVAVPPDVTHGPATAEKVPPAPGEAASEPGAVTPAPRDTLSVVDTLRAVPAQLPAAQPAINAWAPTGAPAPGRGVPQAEGTIPPGSSQRAALLPGEPTLEERGEQLFMTRACVACHTIAGTNAQGMLGPNLTRFGTRRYVGAGTAPATLRNVERWIYHPQDLKPGALMPGAEAGAAGMPATGLSRAEVRAIAAYLKSLK